MLPLHAMRKEVAFLTRRSSCYSAIPYVAAVFISGFLVWIGLKLAFFLDRSVDIQIIGIVLVSFGIVFAAVSLLILWILRFEVVAFQFDDVRALAFERQWGSVISGIQSVDLLLKLGCIFRVGAPDGGCVRYVILRTNRIAVLPMALDLYESLLREKEQLLSSRIM